MEEVFLRQRMPCPVTRHSVVGTQHGQQSYIGEDRVMLDSITITMALSAIRS